MVTVGENSFEARMHETLGHALTPTGVETVQVNVGLRCNLACRHCHVDSSPARTEEMSWETMLAVLDAARVTGARTLDITGGAPEMHPHFRSFVDAGIAAGLAVMVRSNLTVLLLADYADLPKFLAERKVHIVASLPCYLETNVDKQRGKHVYQESIAVIQKLNGLGYGEGSELSLDLVYNPGGPSLPPPQGELEVAYRHELRERYGISFRRLFTITNMPIGRFYGDLVRQHRGDEYQRLLEHRFNPETVAGLMCRNQLHIGWDGTIYDCDFNFAEAMPALLERRNIREFALQEFLGRTIATGAHCFGCTAGCGSSCTGSLADSGAGA